MQDFRKAYVFHCLRQPRVKNDITLLSVPLVTCLNYVSHSAASSCYLLIFAARLFLLRTYKLHASTPTVASLTRHHPFISPSQELLVN